MALMPGGMNPMQMIVDMLFPQQQQRSNMLSPPDLRTMLAQIFGKGADIARGQSFPGSTAIDRERAQQQKAVELQKVWQALMLMQQRRGERNQERWNSPLNPQYANRPLP